jgi:hypothetical protein
MAIPASIECGELVLTSTQTNLDAAITGLLNGIVAHSLPAGMVLAPPGPQSCDQTVSVTAHATSLHAALTDMIDGLLDVIETHDGGIRGVDLHGVMTARDRCTIWGQACLDEPNPYRRLEAEALDIVQAPGEISITVTLRTGT